MHAANNTDWLLDTALIAIVESRPELKNWADSKRAEMTDCNRLDSLRWLVGSLDSTNCSIVCKRLKIDTADLVAVKRVLAAI